MFSFCFALIIRCFIREASLNLCHHSVPGSVSQHLLLALVFCTNVAAAMFTGMDRMPECFIHTLLYLGCQRIMWKIGAGQVIQFYHNWKKIGLVSQMERKLANQTLSNPLSLGLEVFSAASSIYSRDVTITLALSKVLKTVVQVQGQQAVDDLNNTWVDLLSIAGLPNVKPQFIHNIQKGWRRKMDVVDCWV